MIGNHFTHLDYVAFANYRRFVHPGEGEPEWLRRAAAEQRALGELRAERRRQRAWSSRFGLLRRLAMVIIGS